MFAKRYRMLVGLAVLLAAAPGANAQRIGYVFPAGGRQGATVEVKVGGEALQSASAAYVSGQGVKATVTDYFRPLNPKQALELRDKLEEGYKKLTEKGIRIRRNGAIDPAALVLAAKESGVTDAELAALKEYQETRNDPKRQLNQQIAERVTLQITVAPDAVPGERELRLLTQAGLSNPLRFVVGNLPEYRETEPNNRTPDAGIGSQLPAVVNGQILPGDVDRFTFTARKGERLVVAARARELIPYLADAVPGWFQATLELRDAKGREVAYADDFRFLPDPVLAFTVPEDGSYTMEIKDSIYRGREDFVYRITVGPVPYVTSVFPLGCRAGAPATVEAKGWNLPDTRLTVAAASSGVQPVIMRRGDTVSNRVPVAVDDLPEALEKEPNDQTAQAQPAALPLVVNGRVDKPGDRDVFRIQGRAGQAFVAEIQARRLGSPLDSLLSLTDAAGKRLALNDDFEDKGAGLITHQSDSRVQVTLPADGTYFVTLRDAQQKGGAEYAYRLRLSAPRPDFELRVVPSSVNARAGTTIPVTVYAMRRDGFSGDIVLALKNAPLGFTLGGGWVPAGKDQIKVTLTVPATRRDEPVRLSLEGVATVQGQEIRRPAAPADDMMQAFAYRHLVPSEDWLVAVMGRPAFAPALRPQDPAPVKLPAGGTVQVRLPGAQGATPLQITLSEPPEGIALQKVAADPSGVTISLRADAAKAAPGLKGNLIFNAARDVDVPGADGKPTGARRRLPVGMLPAIPFEVVKP